MRVLLLLAVFVVSVSTIATPVESGEPFIADSPGHIRPLLIGADIPDVTLVTPDHQPVVLREVLAKQPTILIYYRGGW